MPQKCVLHVHCVNTLSWVVQNKYEDKGNRKITNKEIIIQMLFQVINVKE